MLETFRIRNKTSLLTSLEIRWVFRTLMVHALLFLMIITVINAASKIPIQRKFQMADIE